ncbi:MAG: hypothetical protein NC209_03920 [Alistipes sp.]|nr:hypothetical protein [Lachnospiraceae bacterium]MCM1250278.1 hypothetical protein [Alistipes sp.]
MNISEHLKKEYWYRRISSDAPIPPLPANSDYYVDTRQDKPGERFRRMTTSDFLNEIDAGAHDINSKYWSMRPVKAPIDVLDANGIPVKDANGRTKTEMVIVGFEDMETTRCALQRRFAIAKANHSAQQGFWLGNESREYKELFAELLSWRDTLGMKTAYFEAVLSLRQTCEAAVYLYQSGNTLQYKVFSALYGDTLFPDYDDNHNPILYRLYTLRGKQAVDIYACGYIETWIQGDKDEDSEASLSWWQKFSGWFAKGLDWKSTVKSEDGWRRLSHKETQISAELNQVVYFRVPDLATGCVQEEIESWERAMSYVAEAMKSDAFPDKFVKATKIKSLPNAEAHGRVYAVEGDADSLKAADMKTVDPGDMSNIATVNIETKMKAILQGSMSVIIEPEILKSGADSSSALRLMFTSEIQDAEAFWVLIAPQVRYMVEVFKALVAKIEGNGDFTKIRTSIEPITWIPQNTAELVENTCKLVYAGIISKEDAASEVDLQYPDGMESIRKEAKEELYQKTYIPLKAKYEAEKEFGIDAAANDIIVNEPAPDNPYKSGVTNQATRR